jgi:hypothetical protein
VGGAAGSHATIPSATAEVAAAIEQAPPRPGRYSAFVQPTTGPLSLAPGLALALGLVACSGRVSGTATGAGPAGAATGSATPGGAAVPPDGPCVTAPGVTTLLADYAYAMAFSGDIAYLATMTGVVRIARAGGAAVSLASGSEAYALVIDATNAYFMSAYAVGAPNAEGKVDSTTALYSVPLGGGAPQLLVDGAFSQQLATDGAQLWWISPGGLQGIALRGTPDPPPIQLGAGTIVEAMAVGADSLFLAVYAISSTGPGVGSIRRAAKDGSRIDTIVDGLGHPTAIALGEDAVYFNDANSAQNGVARADLDGSQRVTLAPVDARSIAVDAHAVYFDDGDSIQAVPKAGGAMRTVATGLKSPGTLAIAGGNVYWVDGTSVAVSDPNPRYAVMTACK